ncbi:hypothetical protein [Ruegeria atlantica]|uniref:hypothetical protein n=1 Tax=Ruegeria atlantica TaxID=81569 RepID=UPI001C2BDBC0|nr:hypothetical protein [Ruegeria atlantica]
MAISYEDCRPYLSATLFRITNNADDLLNDLRKDIIAELRASVLPKNESSTATRSFSTVSDPAETPDGMQLTWLAYEEKRPPAWYSDDDLKNTLHHLVVVSALEDVLAICCTDSAARQTIVRSIINAERASFKHIQKMVAKEVEAAFVEGRVRTLWLSGAHRRSIVKPDAKVLSGAELENALDPLDDQSYFFSSVRTTSSNEELVHDGRNAIVGASPKHARIWLGPSRDWDQFTDRMKKILLQAKRSLDEGSKNYTPIPVLARPTTDIGDVEQPYDVAIIAPEQMLADEIERGDDDRWLQQFADQVHFEISELDEAPNFRAKVMWGDQEYGELSFEFQANADGTHRLGIGALAWDDTKDHQAEIYAVCSAPENLTLYFDTGHTFARGQFYLTQFRDAQFDDWEWVDMATAGAAVKQEKPLDGQRFAVEAIGGDGDASLFGLVVRHWPNTETLGAPTGWLVCDDGAGESADFIHVDDTPGREKLTLIHAKGSGSETANRQISVSDYEVVVGQAIKNLRHVDRGLLHEKLAANGNGVLRDAVWHDGTRQADRTGFLEALARVGSSAELRVVILQPRVRRTELFGARASMAQGHSNATTRRLQQLDALLLGAKANSASLGAEFSVLADAN